MLQYLVAGFQGDKKAFVLFDVFEGTICIGFMRMVPFFQQFWQYYTGFKRQILEPVDGLIMQCQSYLKCLPRPILQLAGYPVIFYFFCAFLVNHFRDFISGLDEGEEALYNHLIIICFTVASYILTYFSSPGFFDTKEDKEELENALMNKAELRTNHRISCNECQLPRVARSQHCHFCQKCVAKQEYHSSVFNKCIGAGNHPYYFFFLVGITALFGYQSVLLATHRVIHEKKYSLLNLLLNYRMFIYYILLLLQHLTNILSNLTYYEIHDARKLPYLWKTLKCEFFNPFDKGVCGNLREFFLVLYTRKSIPLSGQELNKYQTVLQDEKSVIIDKKSAGEHDSSDSSDEEESKYDPNQEIEDEFEEIGREKPIPEKYINWLSKKFYTIIDIPNSPIREFAVVEMKKKLRKEKERNKSNPEFQLQNMLRINQQKVMRGQMTQEEMERQKNEYIEKMNKQREENMKRQLEQQKKLHENNPERAQQDKLYMEMGFTGARIQMMENPDRAKEIEVDLKQAIKNYIYLYGEDAYNQFNVSHTNPTLLENSLKPYAPTQQQQEQPQQPPQPPPLPPQLPKHVYQPEQSHQFHQQQQYMNN